MLNYLKAEFFRTTKRKGYYFFLLIGLGALLFAALGVRTLDESTVVGDFYATLIILISVSAPIFPNVIENLIHKTKGVQCNLITTGAKKEKIVFGDFLATVIATALTVGLLLLLIFGLAATFFTGFKFDLHVFRFLGFIKYAFIMCLPLIGLSIFLNIVFNKAIATTIYYFFNYLFVSIIGVADALTDWKWVTFIMKTHPAINLMKMPLNEVAMSSGFGWTQCSNDYISAAILLVVFLGLGLLIYKKKEL